LVCFIALKLVAPVFSSKQKVDMLNPEKMESDTSRS